MNIGLEQGLRNKLAEAKAKNKMEKARYYVSTTYATIGIISFSFFVIFLFVNQFLDWTKILNTSSDLNIELSTLAIFVFGSFSLTFVLKIITTIAVADQRSSVRNLQNTIGKILKLLFILFLIHFVNSSLLILGIGYSIIPIIVLIGFTIYFFNTRYKNIRPSLKYVDFSYLKDLMNLGVKFFIISIAVVVLFTTDNMIITQLFGPEQVTPYQIAHKYFGIPLMLFMLVVQPLWSAVTDAYNQSDYKWIKNIMKKMISIWGLFTAGVVIMLIVAPIFYKIWLQGKVNVPFLTSLGWSVFVILFSLLSIFTYFINGVGKIKIEMFTSISSMIINIPLSIFLAKTLDFGISGVIYATIFSVSIGLIFRIIQYKKIINHKASGIWNL